MDAQEIALSGPLSQKTWMQRAIAHAFICLNA